MTPVTEKEFHAVLGLGSLKESDPGIGIGREMSFVDNPQRHIVVHFGKNDLMQYWREVTDRILTLEQVWLLVPRYGDVTGLHLLGEGIGGAAVRFTGTERSTLSNYLCTRSMDLGSVSTDLYVLAESGKILVTWDHHTEDEGLSIQFRGISDATKLLVSLNELGAELELFYCRQETGKPDI